MATIAAVFVIFMIACWFGWTSGTSSAQAEATLENATQVQQALTYFGSDQGSYPSTYQFTDQNILNLLYMDSMPSPVDATGICSSYKAFQYAQIGQQDYSLTFCLNAAIQHLGAGVHVFSSQGIDAQSSK